MLDSSIKAVPFSEKVIRESLPNGINVLLKYLPVSEYLIGVSGKGGAIGSTIKNYPSGTAHMLEHVLINQIPSKIRESQNINGKTTHTNISIYSQGKKRKSQEKVVKTLLSSICATPLKNSIQKELPRIACEIKELERCPSAKEEEFISEVYKKTPLESIILGTQESIQKITQENLQSFMDNTFTAGNTLLVAIGNINPEEILRIAKKFPRLKDQPKPQTYSNNNITSQIGYTTHKKHPFIKETIQKTNLSQNIKPTMYENVLIGYKVPYQPSIRIYAAYLAILYSIHKYSESIGARITPNIHYTEKGGLLYFSIPKNFYKDFSIERIAKIVSENVKKDIESLVYTETSSSLLDMFSLSAHMFSIGLGSLTEEDIVKEMKSLTSRDISEGLKIFSSTPYIRLISV